LSRQAMIRQAEHPQPSFQAAGLQYYFIKCSIFNLNFIDISGFTFRFNRLRRIMLYYFRKMF
jgi:hypothetical protein